MADGGSLISLGEVAKPVDTFIKKIAGAAGVVFEPHRIRRAATAEAEAAIIKANAQAEVALIETRTQIQVTDLQRRAFERFAEEEARKQQNIESIAEKAIPLLTADASPDGMADDWVAAFFDKCRLVSDEQMQTLWSRLLAGEANKPGSYSKRTLAFLETADKRDAEAFLRLCGFTWNNGTLGPLVFDVNDAFYSRHGLSFQMLNDLAGLGLLSLEGLTGYVIRGVANTFLLAYHGRVLRIQLKEKAAPELSVGKVMLTGTGRELAKLCEPIPVEGFFDFVAEHFRKAGAQVEEVGTVPSVAFRAAPSGGESTTTTGASVSVGPDGLRYQ